MYAECRWRPRASVTLHVGIVGQQRWRRFSEVSKTGNPRAVESSRCCKRQPWRHGFVGCQGDDVISEVATWVKPSHDWRPGFVVRNITRHRDYVILQYSSRGWQVCRTTKSALYVIADTSSTSSTSSTSPSSSTSSPSSSSLLLIIIIIIYYYYY